MKKPDNSIARVEEKPLDLLKEMIDRYSDKGDIVVDMFLGTGTTASAALLTGRRFYGCDIDKDVIGVASVRVFDTVKYLIKQSYFIF